ncbi:MAG: acetoin utilization protein AcuC [Verrucomicrobia bacterium]|nr:acetoin utilization protein AcuC [Verrucomicrobiota bacterium]
MSDRRLAFIYSPEMEVLSYPPDCPFKTQRTGLTRQRLRSFGLLGCEGRREVAAREAALEELRAFHTDRYLEALDRASRGDLTVEGLHMGLGGEDTPVFKDLLAYGRWAAGGALRASDVLLGGEADVVFDLWGGFHHAFPEHAGGFCYVNDVVLACQRCVAAGRRVAYLDVDAHHGDGVQAAFYDRSEVLTLSMHESGKTLYPWGGAETEIGEGRGLGHNVNVPLPAGTYDDAFLRAFDRVVMPLLRAYGPDLLVVELGMDTLAGDPLTHLMLSNNAHVDLMTRLLGLSRPMLVAGGGGYHVENTVRGWALAWRTCCGEEEDHDLSLGLGGVMLGSTEWAGGLRDPVRPVTPEQRRAVDAELETSLETLVRLVFPHHGLGEAGQAGKAPGGAGPGGAAPKG